jgi:phosphoribosylamine--glycine ligase
MNLLVLGSGGREHAICWSLSKSVKTNKIFAIPGNAGIAEIAEIADNIELSDFLKIKDFIKENNIDLVIVGPEKPLADGITEYLEKYDINILGCDSYSANLESSKSFTKELCDLANIKTAKYKIFRDKEEAISYIKQENKFPQVIKADGLAAGKGVIIAHNYYEAREAIIEIFSGTYGANDQLVIEEFLTGIEASFFAISDGKNFKILGSAGDHKRIGNNDTGKNTGGMGAYSPSPYITKSVEEKIISDILQPTFSYLQEKGKPYKGIIFAGIMLCNDIPYLIEYNIRFGDPEAQTILSRIATDFLDICLAAIQGNLVDLDIKFKNEKALTVVLAAQGYPDSYKKGTEINLAKLNNLDNINIFHAGTSKNNNKLLACGGRVLNITATASSYEEAYEKAYHAAKLVEWDDKYYRDDIGAILFEKG